MMDNSIRAAVLVLACGMVIAGCNDEAAPSARSSAQAVASCNARVLEGDLEAAPPVGPAVDAASSTLQLESGVIYVVSATYGVPKPGTDGAPTAAYRALFGAIEAQLQRESGLLALQLGTSSACRSGRTLAVWRSEEDMLRFVTSPAHLAAMRAAADVLEPGYEATHWTMVGGEPVDWQRAVEQHARDGS